MGAMKAILRGKFLTVNIKKEERSQNQHSNYISRNWKKKNNQNQKLAEGRK